MLGAASLDQEYKDYLSTKNFYFDDAGDNISSLNHWFGDLTGLYWVWKNSNEEIVGTNQYRRYYINEDIDKIKFKKNVIYVSAPLHFPYNMSHQYIMAHGPIGLQSLVESINRNKVKIPVEHIDYLNNTNYISPCNMFFAEREVFNKLCETLFEITFELYEGTKYCLPFIQPPDQTRMIAYLAERILNIIYGNIDYYLGSRIKVQPVNWEVV